MLLEMTREMDADAGGSAEDDGGAGPPLHDDLGGAEAAVNQEICLPVAR